MFYPLLDHTGYDLLSHIALQVQPPHLFVAYVLSQLILNTVSVDTMEWHTRHGVRSAGLINKLLKCSNDLAVRDLHSLDFETETPTALLRGYRGAVP